MHETAAQRLICKFILSTLAVTTIAMLFFCGMSLAQAAAPKRLTSAQPGDCAACHAGGKAVLPGTHPGTKGMNLQACQACHKQDEVPLTDKLPTGHKHMLAGVSCQACHGQKTPFTKVDMKTCTSCHSTAKLASAPARGQFLPNPHNSHYGTDTDCALCHRQHAKSEYFCGQCHDFKDVTPSPLTPLKLSSKAAGAKPSAVSGKAKPAKTAGPAMSCRTCHADPQYQKYFAQTKHGALQCTVCHKGITDFPKHMAGGETVATAECLTCHQAVQKQGLHTTVKQFSCRQCHGAVHPKAAVAAKKAVIEAPAPAAAPAIANCTSCHTGPKYREHFAGTSHGALTCTTCHQGITDLSLHLEKKEKPALIACAVCHGQIGKDYAKSYHAVAAKLTCVKCHTDIHPDRAGPIKKDKAATVATCMQCHRDREKYVNKGHTAKVLAGNRDAAACSDCHGIHNTPVFAATLKGVSAKRTHYTERCVDCHREGGVAGRYGVFPMAVKAYGETYHGKAKQLGYLEKVAGCADCHTGHNILPANDPASALNPKALVKTCGECHKNFHPRFVSYVPHPNPDDPQSFPGLYYTKVFMIALLFGVFAFFWVHSLLWWRKVYAEKSALVKQGLQVKTELPEKQGRQYVRRFTVSDRIMHIVLIFSFLGVVVSGFPIKYPEAWASRVFITLFGGVENAAYIHRISAVAMWLLFLYTCWIALAFLCPRFKVRGWVGRLFGPESLFPRIKDFQDCWGMFKWFFNAGEKPQFDRWTYWEKFDFFAVFWGMFVIGLSGVIMWIPEQTSYVMPGWMINISHLAHSEEAFLAAVFIFTVHFFNNHLVPDKFPLERNIFTGSYTLEALKRERPLEYERILQENRLEEIKCPGPGAGIQLFAGIFGIVSVLLGLLFTILIFIGVFTA